MWEMMAPEPKHVYVLANKLDKYDSITTDINKGVNRLGSAPLLWWEAVWKWTCSII